MTSIETKQIDGVWWARWSHHLLGPIDARGLTEQAALANFRDELKAKCEAYRREHYNRLRERFPEYLKRTAA